MRRFIQLAALGSWLAAASAVAGPILQFDETTGALTGASQVSVVGALYDVTFVNGTCVELFSGCSETTSFQFQTQDAATEAARALLEQVLSGIDAQPNPDCSTLTACAVRTPYGLGTNNTVLSALAYDDGSADPTVRYSTARRTYAGLPAGSVQLWAIWSAIITDPDPNPVPEPATFLLLLIGIGALLWRKRAILR